MSHYNLALIGFGNVGKAFARLLMEKQHELLARYNLTFAVTGIATSRHGCAIDHGGLDLERALVFPDIGELSTQPVKFSSPAFDFIRSSGADLYQLNTDSSLINSATTNSGNRPILAIEVGDDGAIYAGNLTDDAQSTGRSFHLYLWTTEVFRFFQECLLCSHRAFQMVLKNSQYQNFLRFD